MPAGRNAHQLTGDARDIEIPLDVDFLDPGGTNTNEHRIYPGPTSELLLVALRYEVIVGFSGQYTIPVKDPLGNVVASITFTLGSGSIDLRGSIPLTGTPAQCGLSGSQNGGLNAYHSVFITSQTAPGRVRFWFHYRSLSPGGVAGLARQA